MDILRLIELGLVSAATALVGSMLGLGGGVFLVPILTLFFDVNQKVAIGASSVAVATNSILGSTVHLQSRFTNLRFAMLLQIATATGALIGATVGVWAPERPINVLFGVVLLYAAGSMAIRRKSVEMSPDTPDPHGIKAAFIDPATKKLVTYVPQRLKLGLWISGAAGALSGMLGVGGGVVQVPAMNILMKVPVKAAAGTSSFMVGVTAVATSFVYYSRERIDPSVVVPAMVGVFVGAQAGSKLTRRVSANKLSAYFVVILLYLSVSLLAKAAGFTLPGQS